MGDWYVYNGDVFDGPSKISGILSAAVKHNNDVRQLHIENERLRARVEELEANDGEGHKRCACVWSDNDEVIRPCVAHLWSWSKHNEARAEEYEEELKADRAFCICGCLVADHESYGEDGISCGHDDHERLFTCAAIAAGYQELQREVERLKNKRIDDGACDLCGRTDHEDMICDRCYKARKRERDEARGWIISIWSYCAEDVKTYAGRLHDEIDQAVVKWQEDDGLDNDGDGVAE